MSMAVVSSQTLSFDSISNLREASFSSYLHGDEGILALSLSESNQNINTTHDLIYASPKKIEDKEIGVFSAEKYFKGDMDDDGDPKSTDTSSKSYQHEKDIPVNIDPVKPKVQPRTPSIRSSSSYSSQTVLLPTNHQSRNTKKAFCKSFLSSLSCKCSCNEKNPVVINDHVVESKKQSKIPDEQTNKAAEPDQKNKAPARRWSEQEKVPYKKFDEIEFQSRRKESFNFPVLNPKKGSLAATVESPGEDNARKSLEVFGSPRTPITNQVNKTLSFGRKAAVFTWDLVNPQMDETGLPKNQDVTSDDYESDASSELFEIESFSTKTNSILGRQTTDGASGCLTPTTCYAPSEASIQWSVITASAADFSIMSDSEDLRTANTKNQNRMTSFAKNGPEKELHKRLPNILSGCKSQKAVRVAGDAYKASDKVIPISQGRHRLDPSKPVAKFQAETKLTGFNSRLGSNAFNTSVVSPGNGSHLLYIK
ncbi:Phytochrome kinase substrate 1 [Heracleum sosnowskyi]|uniref:Phytochrome kinase substrate 1 n=1 Tax=Heracleum sosnowskyi TaxID=360622 RepID=A0AAD8MZ80_9APIA|nr:Phytochrome kinase substrate 1 [Heracleum sosnowskyi]